jgi:DNA-binding MarR family transcriptional regulator
MNDFQVPNLPCLCSSFRRSSRALTQLYEYSLRPLGLSSTQFTVLQVLDLAGATTQGRLGQMLAMDSTSLTRTLRIMSRHGWISERRGEDRRKRWLQLAPRGKAQLKSALPVWEKVQANLRHQLGASRWDGLLQITNQLTNVAINQLTKEGRSL